LIVVATKSFYITILESEIQRQIAALVQENFALCEESKRFLKEAKEMVEREIEKER
jgi:hypothetical protein